MDLWMCAHLFTDNDLQPLGGCRHLRERAVLQVKETSPQQTDLLLPHDPRPTHRLPQTGLGRWT